MRCDSDIRNQIMEMMWCLTWGYENGQGTTYSDWDWDADVLCCVLSKYELVR